MPTLNKAENLATLVITILGVAYPIILEINSRLNDRYSSDRIVRLFELEPVYRYFKLILVGSLITVLLWIFDLPPVVNFLCFQPIIENSATLILIFFATALTVSFFYLVKLTLVYNTPVKLVNWLIQKAENDKSSEALNFGGLVDVFIHSIKKQDHPTAAHIGRFFYNAFKKERVKQSGSPVIYPDRYYQLVYKSIEELRLIKDNRNRAIETRTAGSIWLLGELRGSQISKETYTWLWRNVSLAVEYNNDDLIMHHWKNAHQYIEFCLDRIHSESGGAYSDPPFKIINELEIKKREAERNKFIEFHVALGGLLMYRKRHDCINRIFNYTQSEPPSYPLLPNNMTSIFELYYKFRDSYDQEYHWISSVYPFPDSEGMKSDSLIRKWIFHYLAILFLRQFTLRTYLITQKPVALPRIPESQGAKRTWLEGLPFFKETVEFYLRNEVVMNRLEFDNIFHSEEEYLQKKRNDSKEGWSDFFKRLEQQINKDYQRAGETLKLDDDKVHEFILTSQTNLETFLHSINPLSNSDTNQFTGLATNDWNRNGHKVVMEKEAFSNTNETYYHERDSFLSSGLVSDLRYLVGHSFEVNKSTTFNIKQEELILALESLNLNSNHVIVSCGMKLNQALTQIEEKQFFNQTEVINLGFNRGAFPCLFILCKSDLPLLNCKPLSQEAKDKYKLSQLGTKFHIYGNILDLNTFPQELILEYPEGRTLDELKRSVLLYLEIDFEIKWKKDVKVLQVYEYSRYQHKGLPTSLNEVSFEWSCDQII